MEGVLIKLLATTLTRVSGTLLKVMLFIGRLAPVVAL